MLKAIALQTFPLVSFLVSILITLFSARASNERVKLKEFDFSIRLSEMECEVERPLAEALSKAQSSLRLSGFGLKLGGCADATAARPWLLDRQGVALPVTTKNAVRLQQALYEAGLTIQGGIARLR